MREWLHKLFNLGSDVSHYGQKKRVILSNQIAFVFILVSGPYFFIFRWMHLDSLSSSVIPFVVWFGSAFFLNRSRHYKLAKLMLILASNTALFFYSLTLGKDAGMFLIFFALTAIPFVFYDSKKEFIEFIFALALPIACLFYLEFTGYYPFFGAIPLSGLYTKIIYSTMIAITFTIIIMAIRFYSSMNEKSQDELQETIKELKCANESEQELNKQLQASLEKQQEMANQVAYAEMVRWISHEIKNPMQMIYGGLEFIVDPENPQDMREKYYEVVKETCRRIIKMMQPMMHYGKAAMAYDPSEINVAALFEEIGMLAEGTCRKKRIKFSLVCDEALTVYADRGNIAQILINLVSNAQQYTPEKGGITLSAERCPYTDLQGVDRAGVCISVTDTGVGMSEETCKQIFSPFFSTKSESHNVGLGLTVVQRCVEGNHGRITVTSKEGEGTQFKIYVPLVPA
jgi:signal transduction histidine kinase